MKPREALEEQHGEPVTEGQEPVLFAVKCNGRYVPGNTYATEAEALESMERLDKLHPEDERCVVALYDRTAPAQPADPTDDQLRESILAAVEKFGGKEAFVRAMFFDEEPAQPVQEPVAEVAGRADALHIKFLPAGLRLGLGDKLYSTAPAQPAPPECQTEAEKTAYAFGWYKAMEHVREQPALKPLSADQDRALCEAHCNEASDEYFKARPQLDSAVNRRIFYAGHRKAWIAYEAAHGIKEQA
jgi:hypothetical protein